MKIPVFSILFIIISQSLFGAYIPSYDMASLAFMADVVISTKTPPSERDPKTSAPPPTMVVINHVFKGALKEGESIELRYYDIPQRSMTHEGNVMFESSVLFLRRREDPKTKQPYFVQISSGFRVIGNNGSVYRGKQYANPGPLELVTYLPEFVNFKNFGPEDIKFDIRDSLIADVRAAVKRAKMFEEAEARGDFTILDLFVYPTGFDYDNYLRRRVTALHYAKSKGLYLDSSDRSGISISDKPF